jgi:Family of unknown function (DUF5694)
MPVSSFRFSRGIAAAFALSFCLNGAAQADDVQLLSQRQPGARPQLMVLGVVHFGNPGLDMKDPQVPDVTTPERQAQLQAVIDSLARFHPTHVAIEFPIKRQADLDKRYADYLAGRYTLKGDETDQLGLRLARALHLPRVDAVDWNENPPGADKDYDFQAYAAAHGMKPRYDAIVNSIDMTDMNKIMRDEDVRHWLLAFNAPEAIAKDERIYYDFTMLGDAGDSPGANWVASWWGRNLKIFANLVRVADKPDDRVIAIFGAGHAGPLTDAATNSGAFDVVSPLEYLRGK